MRGRSRRKRQVPPKASDRLAVLQVIEQLEREGKFDVDAEEDPPTIPLLPDMVDYLKVRPDSILKRNTAYLIANRFVDKLIREKKLVIRKVYGMEYLNRLDTGAVITCNHFNPFDCFTVERIFQRSAHYRKKKLFKVIREGNYTNFPGFYGYLFRNCDTLPLSGNKKTMYNFLMAVDTILQRGDFILIYPEQSLWWNYRKPKPLKNGAFKFAEKNHVPVLPIFICMEDSERIGNDGFPIQEYTIFINEPIYPKAGLTEREKAADMRDRNYQVWKNVYEEFYGIPLEYTTEKAER
ncbi:MAG: 1-acyl-sn-glycerol-3-phosphate acyltransferase [Blautia sp.]|nr:1-acyl-sn-glycerol-3-phosphate acyltransferase [Blautia sp.]